MSVLAFMGAVVLFLGLLSIVRFQLKVVYKRVNEDDSATLVFSGFFGLWRYQIDIGMMDWRWTLPPQLRLETLEKNEQGVTNKAASEIKPRGVEKKVFRHLLPRLVVLFRQIMAIKSWFYKGIRCTQLNWSVEVGLSDAAETGIAVGTVWGVLGYYLGKLHNNITFRVVTPQVAVYPSFREPIFKADINCIFSLRIGHIIFAGFKVLKIVRLGLKGGKKGESPD